MFNNEDDFASASGSGSQNSSLSSNEISATGSASYSTDHNQGNIALAYGNSSFEVVFELEEETVAQLNGFVSVLDFADAEVVLSGESGGVVTQYHESSSTTNFDEQLVLPPDIYTLTAIADAISEQSLDATVSAEYSFTFSVVVPEPSSFGLLGFASSDLSGRGDDCGDQ